MSTSHRELLSKKDSARLLDLKAIRDALPLPASAAPAGDPRLWVLKARGARPQPNAKLRLFCFPHAGSGSYIFHGWEKELPIAVEVGRGCVAGRAGAFGGVAAAPACRCQIGGLTRAAVLHPDQRFVVAGRSAGPTATSAGDAS